MLVEKESRVVGREDLYSDQSSKESTPDLDTTNRLRSLLNAQYGTLDIEVPRPEVLEPAKEEPAEEELEFRLFASSAAPQKIVIRSPSPSNTAPGFVQAARPSSYYFAETPSENILVELEAVALSGNDVLARSQSRWAGCALPWKIITASSEPKMDGKSQELGSGKRRRPSKKARIALRVKIRQKEAKEEMAKKALEEKEVYLRDKKSAQNRKKQLKRRAKEKAKKAEGAEGESAPAG